MKMAKPSEKDIDAAAELCRLLNELDEGNRWSSGALGDTVDFFEIEDFDPEKKSHLEPLYDKLMNLMHAQPSFHNRVIGGMCYVIMYDANEIIDPDSDHLDMHPRFAQAFDDLARETQAARYWNMRYHQVAQELEQVKLSAQRISQEWATIWSPIDEIVRPVTPLGESVSAKAVELLIGARLGVPDYSHDVAHSEIVSLIENVRRHGLDHTGCEPSVSRFHQAVDNLRMALENPPAMPIPKQEPVGICKQVTSGEKIALIFPSKALEINHGDKLYAAPQPAQAAAIPDWENESKRAFWCGLEIGATFGATAILPRWNEYIAKRKGELSATKPDSTGGES